MVPHRMKHMDVYSEEASGKAPGMQMSLGLCSKEPSVCADTGVWSSQPSLDIPLGMLDGTQACTCVRDHIKSSGIS